jgi:hypothetical protein
MRNNVIISRNLTLVGIFVAALACRLVYTTAVRTAGDLTTYHYHEAAALNLLAGKGLVVPFSGRPEELVPMTQYPPGYVVFLAGVYALLGRGVGGVQLVQSLLGALGCVLLALTVERALKDSKTAFWSGMGAALLPISAVHDVYVNSHTGTSIFLLLLSLFFWYRAKEPNSVIWYAATGFTLGVTALFHSEAIALLPLLGILTVVEGRSRKALKHCAVILLCGVTVLVPWTIRNGVVLGTFSPTEGEMGGVLVSVIGKFYPDSAAGFAATDGEILAAEGGGYTDYSWPDPYGRDQARRRRVMRFILNNPGKYAAVLIKNVPIAWFGQQLYLSRLEPSLQSEIRGGRFLRYMRENPLGLVDRGLGTGIALVVFASGLYGFFVVPASRCLLPFVAIIVYYLVIFIPLGGLGRYTIPAYVLMIPFAVMGFENLFRRFGRGQETAAEPPVGTAATRR